jgi:hypothetical protein
VILHWVLGAGSLGGPLRLEESRFVWTRSLSQCLLFALYAHDRSIWGLRLQRRYYDYSSLPPGERMDSRRVVLNLCRRPCLCSRRRQLPPYLAIGWLFAGFYTLLGLLVPDAFSGMTVSDSASLASDMAYFSFGTLTTAGSGDIAPIHAIGRSLVNIEAMIGQLYPATLLARLVTLEIEGEAER